MPVTRKTIVHIGTHKTGTTTLQRYAKINRDALRDMGIIYPRHAHKDGNRHTGHHMFANAVAGEFPSEAFRSFEDAKSFIQSVADDRGDDESVFISAEPMYRLKVGTGDIYDGKRRYFERLKEVLAPLGEIEIALVVRRQDTFAQSNYQEIIKAWRYTKSFEEFYAENLAQLNYLWHYRCLKDLFGTVRVLVYEDLGTGDALVKNFFDALGLGHDIVESKKGSVNESLHPSVVDFKRMINSTDIGDAGLDSIRKSLPETSRELYHGARIALIEPAKLEKIYADFREENRILAAEIGAANPDLFPERKPAENWHKGATRDELEKITRTVEEKTGLSLGAYL